MAHVLAIKSSELLAVGDGPAKLSAAQLAAAAPADRWVGASAGHGAKGRRLVRRWPGWYRHITLALLAHAFLVVTRTQAGDHTKGDVAA